ncbi:hypothetical protein BLA60_23320 [Actinophytocola xinjiangensis]|uniref:Peptidase S8/S53 domain-containing protein n=1 Tax=Actinophytocola xinjiangensis TaxID=485602 RepID=A0A7Z1AXW2_9PSEU|nr:S8 family serine peptidase [Actinophytocola xinjiangensis]OLF08358.1 hypothetical protein BLA60_23320 [Actinophytocola xinjiangensis]
MRRGAAALATAAALAVAGPVPASSAAPPTDSGGLDSSGMDKLASSLLTGFEKSGGASQDFWVSFDDRADLTGAAEIENWAERGQFVVDRLRDTAKKAQADTVSALDAAGVDYKSYWVTNAIRVHGGDMTLAVRLAGEAEVERVFAPVAYERHEPVEQKVTGNRLNAAEVVEWGVSNIKADQVWERYGVRGDGIVVANIDSGVQFDHPALVSSYRGYDAEKGSFDNDYNWLDVSGSSSYPNDGHGHGTHTMGTMVGDDGAANRTGVAPGARWIAANGCCPSDQALIDSAQWMLAPTKVDGTAPDPAKRPHVVNNSWGSDVPTNDPFMEDILTSWADAGIFGVWANGNDGALGCESSGTPGSRTINYSVGAYDSANAIAPFSARGPGQDGEVKPNITAPGVNVRSAIPGNRYGTMSGTSMATPHVAGAVALLWSADPSLVGDLDRTRQLLDDTATDTADDQCGGTTDDNNVFGEGRLDALALVSATNQAELGEVTGTVTHDGTGEPVRGAAVRLTSGDLVRSVRTADDGSYGANVPVGEYQATVTAFGYETTTVAVTVTAGQTTNTDVRMPAVKGFTVSGKVLDEATGKPLPGAKVTVAGTRFATTTGADGGYSVPNVPGPASYLLTIDGGRCTTGPLHRGIDLRGDLTVPTIRAPRQIDTAMADGWWDGPYGYSCVQEPVEWIGGDTEIEPPTSTWGATKLTMPFGFTYYGQYFETLYVNSHGMASFSSYGEETRINFGVKAFYSTFVEDPDSKMYTRSAGQAPNRTFTVEWREHAMASYAGLVTAALTLHENGDIVFAYKDLDPNNLGELGAAAEIGLESPSPDLQAGKPNALTLSHYEPVLNDDYQYHFSLPSAGTAIGKVTDQKTGKPIPGATVDLYGPTGKLVRRQLTDDAGRYRAELFTGQRYRITAVAPPGFTVVSSKDVTTTADRGVITVNHALGSGGFDVGQRELRIRAGDTKALRVTNSGREQLDWYATARVPGSGPAPGTALGSLTMNVVVTGVEEVNETYWVSSVASTGGQLAQVTANGRPTGKVIDTASVSRQLGTATQVVPGDLTWLPRRNWLCMNVLQPVTVSDIVCVDPNSSTVTRRIPTGMPATTRGVGLAYDEDRDLFFVGVAHVRAGYQQRILTIEGVEHQDPGTTVNTCLITRQARGLGWNPTSRSLWTTSQQLTDFPVKQRTWLRQVDPETCSEISAIPLDPAQGLSTMGLDLDPEGNAVTTVTARLGFSTVATGDPIAKRVDWLTLSPAQGSLDARRRQNIDLTVNPATVPDGADTVEVVLHGNGGATPTVTIPVTVTR